MDYGTKEEHGAGRTMTDDQNRGFVSLRVMRKGGRRDALAINPGRGHAKRRDEGDLALAEPQFPYRNLTAPHQSVTAA
jgi:hypothetical protein